MSSKKAKYKKAIITTREEAIKEAYRYLDNAKETLSKIPIENNIYKDAKYVKEAAGIAYLSALTAIDGYLIWKGIEGDKLPASFEGYRAAVHKNIPLNGKLHDSLTVVYQNLHIFAYYRGGVGVEMVKEGFNNAKKILKCCQNNIIQNKKNLPQRI